MTRAKYIEELNEAIAAGKGWQFRALHPFSEVGGDPEPQATEVLDFPGLQSVNAPEEGQE